MAPTLYLTVPSPPARSVLITAKALGIQLKLVDMYKGEHTRPEFSKINPQQTVPTLIEDDGFAFWDNHAINAYLVSKYAKDDSLYPKDLKKRAIVDQRLHFDSGVAFAQLTATVSLVVGSGKRGLDDEDKENITQVYAFLEAFLDGKGWVAGDSLTIADYCLYSTISSLNTIVSVDGKKYPKVIAWLKKVGDLPEAEVSKKGLAAFKALMKNVLSN